jgi:hypothetical protein
MSNYTYPREAPKWVEATSVQAATPDGRYVNVKADFGEEQEFKMCRVGWNDRFMNKAKSDVDVQTQEYGWLRIWFHNADVQPYREAS